MSADSDPARPQLSGGDAAAGDEAVEAERGRIAHELHDALLPLLFAARMHTQRLAEQVQSADQPAPQLGGELTALADELGEAMATGRRILVGLHPPELSSGDWHQAVRYYVDRGLDPGQTRVQLHLQPETAILPAPRALAAYRIVQEAVRNAIRHARAGQVEVMAVQHPGGVRLTIRDDGRGFDPADVPADRFGVRGIVERARRAEGTAVIRSRPGGGTTIEVDLPA